MRGNDAPRPGRRVDLRSPRGYYFDYTPWADPRRHIDERGLPLARRPAPGESHSPLEVARFALGNLEIYLENGSKSRRSRFESGVRWLLMSAEEIPGGFVGWPMPVVPEAYRNSLAPGWFSGAAHGECVSALARAASLFGIDGALETARRAVGGFSTPVEDGGFMREIGEGGHEGGLDSMILFEEYPMVDRPSLTLAGQVKALLGLFDYGNVEGGHGGETAFDRGVRGLSFELARYDLDYWTRHDLDEHWRGARLADTPTLELQSQGLRVLASVTRRSEFREAAERWAGYAASASSRARAAVARLRFGLLNPGSGAA